MYYFCIKPKIKSYQMAYTDSNFNQKVLDVINIYDHYSRMGVPNTVIYRDYIKPAKFYIGWSTFCRYLKISEDVKKKVNEQKQLTLF